MAGLLDAFGDENARFSLGLLAAAAPRFDGANDGQRIMEALQGVDSWKQKQAQAKMQQMQMEAYQAQAEQTKQEREQRARISAGMGQFFTKGQPALAPLMGDSSIGIQPSAGRAAVAPSFDSAGAAQWLAQNGDVNGALAMLPKAAKFSTEVRYDQNGNAFMTAEDGSMKPLEGIKARDKLQEVRLGDKVGFRTEYSPEMRGSLPIGQSPDSKAGNAVTMRGQNMTDARARDRLNFEQMGGTEGGGGTSQMGLNKLFGKPQAGYRWKADGSLEFIPGGPADQKAQAQKGGEGTVGGVVADLRDKYTQLNAENGIVSTNNRVGTNLGAAFGSSDFGQKLNGMVGTKTQSARDSIAMTRPLLLQSIMKATGMSAKQMDSNAELKLYLATATDPQKGLEANLEALDRIEALYGGGNEKFNAGTPQASTNNGWSMQKVK